MIHVVAMKCLIGLPLLMHIGLFEGVGVGVLKIEESESELLCTDSTALVLTPALNDLLRFVDAFLSVC
jgi:hypothetical protein